MPVKLIHNTLLSNPPLSVTHFKPNSTLKPSRVVPIFSRDFPHKLKYQSFSKRIGYTNGMSQIEQQLGIVREFSSGRPSSEIKASKSLIEDEAELSEWVTELRSDLFRSSKTNLYNDKDDNDKSGSGRYGASSGKRRRKSDSDGYGNSSRGRGGYLSRERGNQDSFDSLLRDSRGGRGGYSSRGRGNRDSFDSLSRGSRGNGRSSGDFEGKGEHSRGWGGESHSNDYGMSSSSRGGLSSSRRGGLPNRGIGGLMNRRRGSWDSNDNGRGGFSNRGRSRGGRDSFESFSRESRGKGRFGDEMEERNERVMPRRKDNDSRGGRNSLMGSRGGRGLKLGSRRDRGDGRGGGLRIGSNTSKIGGLMMLDIDDIDGEEEENNEVENEEVGKVRDSFWELNIGEDSEEDSGAVDEDDGEEVFKNAGSLSKLEIEDGPAISLTSLHDGSDSYLSETR